jgi:hypothetical protein
VANPRVIFTLSKEAKAAMQRVSERTGINEANLMRQAIADILAKHGEVVSVEVDRGGYRGGSKDKQQSTDE